jgi:hypothetical protein
MLKKRETYAHNAAALGVSRQRGPKRRNMQRRPTRDEDALRFAIGDLAWKIKQLNLKQQPHSTEVAKIANALFREQQPEIYDYHDIQGFYNTRATASKTKQKLQLPEFIYRPGG